MAAPLYGNALDVLLGAHVVLMNSSSGDVFTGGGVGGGGEGGDGSGGTSKMTPWAMCPLLNASECPATTADTVLGKNVTVAMWNSIAQSRTELVRIMLPRGAVRPSRTLIFQTWPYVLA